MRKLVAFALLLQVHAVAWPQDAPDDRRDRRSGTQQMAGQLLETFRGLGDWREHYGYMMDAVDGIYEANQWNSEPDQFSRELIHTVEAVEPWDFQGRLDTMVGMFSDRYLLDEEQEEKLRDVFMQQMGGIVRDHGPRIMEYAGEIVKTRAAGEPFTPELVARWTKMSQPVYEDMKKRMNRMAGEFMQDVGPQQRSMIEADLGAANTRLKRVDELNEQWRNGQWTPADWGMHNDPIQLAGEARVAAGGGATGGAVPIGGKPARPGEAPPAAPGTAAPGAPGDGGVPAAGADGPPAPPGAEPTVPGRKGSAPAAAENDAWSQYVRDFIRRYQLDADQAQRAWLIHGDVRARAGELGVKPAAGPAPEKSGGKPGTNGSASAAGTDSPAGQRLFDQMKRRLERLPTRAQRRAANAAGSGDSKPAAARPAEKR
ncbi:hypothetical protein RAS1_25300 [Phycisphaerae bacterium RAS1]|nr:hypothetical protein RAS1_25300 [Phycisphaerae bacterium RAS1]